MKPSSVSSCFVHISRPVNAVMRRMATKALSVGSLSPHVEPMLQAFLVGSSYNWRNAG